MSVRKRTEAVDWDGLRFFRAVVASGTLTGAARALRVEHTTVARQIDRLEAALGARLFLRNPRGYVPTQLGLSLLESVDAIGARVDEAVRLAAGEDVELAGSVRVATADLLATHIVAPALAELIGSAPRLDVTVISDTRQHDLSRHEADLALRLGTSDEPHLVSRRLARLGFGVYAAKRSKLGKAPRFVMFDESVGRQPHDEWLSARHPDARIVFRANRQHTLIEAVRQGIGAGILPCIAGDRDPSLVRLLGPDDVFTRDMFVVLHPDLRHARRVRAVVDAIEAHVGSVLRPASSG